jgi:cyclic pyranopterin phosphate synthase
VDQPARQRLSLFEFSFTMMCTDNYGRKVDYLRVSLTDRCNLRCVYCMPPEGIPWKPHAAILHFEQIAQIVGAAAGLGFRKIRLTGGEPLVRKDSVDLVASIAATPGIEEVSMTTNGTLLSHFARDLAAAGLTRVNVSLDTLHPDRFQRITRLGDIGLVWDGIQAAERAGLTPLKINVVVIRGLNDDEIADFARLTFEHAWHVRFIELMPVGNRMDWGPDMPAPSRRFVSVAEMRQRLAALGGLTPVGGPPGNGPARYFQLPQARGSIGFISPLTEHFCATCNRLRLTAQGQLRPCLFSDRGVSVKSGLDAGGDVHELQTLIGQAIRIKPLERPFPVAAVAEEAMSILGG